MHKRNSEIIDEVTAYYEEKHAEHGDTPLGVDWNSEESQIIRFEQLCKIIESGKNVFSINDLGCGYGALLDYMREKSSACTYIGVDISHEMVSAAAKRHINDYQARFIVSTEPDLIANYSVASGIFNVRLKRTDSEWFDYFKSILDILDKTSSQGFAFNCLTSYSEDEKKRDYLYYADPCKIFDLCKQRYSRNIALLHDYGLYEFTILVKKTL